MRRWTGSIRLRLALAAGAAIAFALVLSWIGLSLLFDRQALRLAQQELVARSYVLAGAFEPGVPPAAPDVEAGHDPDYLRPYSGRYWQVAFEDEVWRSRSLWDATLDVSASAPPVGTRAFSEAAGPDGQRLLILDWVISVGPRSAPVRITVATSRDRFEEARGAFISDVLPFLVALGLFLVAMFVAQVTYGLRAFRRIERDIAALNAGDRKRLEVDVPREVRPLASAVNALLDDRDRRIARARHRAADLAHTLKTPMQAVLGETGRLRERGEAASADAIEEIVGTIGGRIDRELGRAAIGAEGRADLAVAVGRVTSVLGRTARGDEIAIETDVAPGLHVRLDQHDLVEVIGSVAENALRHARGRIRLRAEPGAAEIVMRVTDDGPGIPEEHLDGILKRGARLDSASTGLGLALALDILDAAGGGLALRNLPDGFEVTLSLPRAG